MNYNEKILLANRLYIVRYSIKIDQSMICNARNEIDLLFAKTQYSFHFLYESWLLKISIGINDKELLEKLYYNIDLLLTQSISYGILFKNEIENKRIAFFKTVEYMSQFI